ncbi:MAG: hypothetical protein M1168_03865 [Candidatus Marsarchaeota archaeon]|nr:hypothetical protein [Candidatus Marsarchaeota archaeon]MCL5095085.1 hypothetical protein [Candidatus Marsarchaeota archaeon]
MKKYSKGARSERELLMQFYNLSYSVMRAAGSGVNSLSPDIIAIKEDKLYAFECKAWNSNLLIEPERFESLKQWEKNTRMQVFIAWRINNKGWFFIKLEELSKNGRNYTLTKNQVFAINRKFESVI